jgi:mannose/fructose/N-acetylgalactosamine-specific phosphotransferase system component IIB
MIRLTRIDDRLLHGQVAFTWVPALAVNCLIIANDKVAKDEFMKLTLGLAKPAGTKLLIMSLKDTVTFLNDEKNKGQKILLLINSVKDAYALAVDVPEILSVNFGGLRSKEGSKLISKAIAITEDDLLDIKKLISNGIELEIRQVPTDSKLLIEGLIESKLNT